MLYMIRVVLLTSICFRRIVQSFEMLATQYTQQIPPNTAVNFTAPSVTISTENVCDLLYRIITYSPNQRNHSSIQVAIESLQSAGRDIAFGMIL